MYFNNFDSSEKDATWKDKKSKAASKNDEGKHIDQNLFKDTEVIPFDKRNDTNNCEETVATNSEHDSMDRFGASTCSVHSDKTDTSSLKDTGSKSISLTSSFSNHRDKRIAASTIQIMRELERSSTK